MMAIEEYVDDQLVETIKTKYSQDFKNAMAYVDYVQNNENVAAIYQNDKQISDHQLKGLAFHDFITPPQIIGIYVEKYYKNKFHPIVVRAKDDFGVKQVLVTIFNSRNELLEKGLAQQFLQKERWFYFIRKDLEGQGEIRIETMATDYPGNYAVSSQWIMV